MSQIVATGQITIIDQNDARQLQCIITASLGLQQVYGINDTTVTYNPNYTTSNNILTAIAYSANADVTSVLTNVKWSTTKGGTSLGSASTYSVSTNILTASPSVTYWFQGDYTDPATSIVTTVYANITLSVVQTGSNAVYINCRGISVIKSSSYATKNVAVIAADLTRASGIETSGVTYKFFEQNGTVLIDASLSGVATKYGRKLIAPQGSVSALPSEIGVGNAATGTWTNNNTLVIAEPAVNDVGVYVVQAMDNSGKIYEATFTVWDITDPYTIVLVSTNGDKLPNGTGSTNIYPVVYQGGAQLMPTTGWTFIWNFNDGTPPGYQAGFVDTVRTVTAGGRNITGNTIGPGAVFTFDGAPITFAIGDMIKCVAPNRTPYYYEVAAVSSGNTVTIRVATICTWLNVPWPAGSVAVNQFQNGHLFVCKGTGATAGTQTTNGGATTTVSQITVTSDEIDIKGTILCSASRP